MSLQVLSLHPLLQGLQSFVGEYKARQVAGVGVGGLQDGFELVLQTVVWEREKNLLTCTGSIRLTRYININYSSNSYLPLLKRNVITKACGALILAPYLRNKHTVMSVLSRNPTGLKTRSNIRSTCLLILFLSLSYHGGSRQLMLATTVNYSWLVNDLLAISSVVKK